MIPSKVLAAAAVLASVAFTACSQTAGPNSLAPEGLSLAREGTAQVTKECSAYTGQAGDFCTITSSSIREIEVGSRVYYSKAAGPGSLDSDITLSPPGPGNNSAYGHCGLDFATGVGLCTFSGGTGRFTWFRASFAVSYLGGPNWGWDGTYKFSPRI